MLSLAKRFHVTSQYRKKVDPHQLVFYASTFLHWCLPPSIKWAIISLLLNCILPPFSYIEIWWRIYASVWSLLVRVMACRLLDDIFHRPQDACPLCIITMQSFPSGSSTGAQRKVIFFLLSANTFKLRHYGRQFKKNIFKLIFMYENYFILIFSNFAGMCFLCPNKE